MKHRLKVHRSLLQVVGMALVALMGAAACAPSAPQLKKVMEDNPDILYAAMRKDPVKFMEVVNEVAKSAEEQKESRQFEEGFKSPRNPALSDARLWEGPKDAPITIVEYSDFQCPHCKTGHSTMNQLMQEYKGKIRLLFKNYPIDRIHPQARKMSRLYEAIGTKDKAKAIEFKNYIFDHQDDFVPNENERKSKTQEEFMSKYNRRVDADLAKVVKKMGFDFAELKKIGDSDAITKQIEEDSAEAQNFGFTGTPGYLVNGVALRGAYPIEAFKQVIDRLSAKK